MDTIVTYLSVLILSSTFVDWLLRNREIIALRLDIGARRGAFNSWKEDDLRAPINFLFCQIFDAFYGPRTWSLRRISRSCFLSVLFVFFSISIIGYENTFLGLLNSDDKGFIPINNAVVISALVMLTIMNLAIDFVSLQETRWVLQRTLRGATVSLMVWAIIDLILTTSIYLIGFGLLIFVIDVLTMGISYAFDTVFHWEFIELLTSPRMGLPFFVSTFGTSVVWFLFVVFVLAVRGLNYSVPSFKFALEAVSHSEAPARTIAGIFLIPIAIVLCLVEAVRWLF